MVFSFVAGLLALKWALSLLKAGVGSILVTTALWRRGGGI